MFDIAVATLLLTMTAGPPLPPGHQPGAATETASTVNDFLLEDADGGRIRLYDGKPHLATVIAFTSVDCPIAKLYGPRLGRLHREYAGEGIRFLGINPNFQDKPEEIRERAQKVGIEFPVLCDPFQVVTHRLEVTRTTEVLVLNDKYEVVYRGALDDQYGVGTQKPHPTEEFLVEAMEAILADEEVTVESNEAPGCLIGRTLNTDLVRVNYRDHVAQILHQQCADCHRPGQIGPMSLLEYEDAASWAPMIAEVVGEGRMPPWHADSRYGSFRNERRLTESEQALLQHWAESGAPRGEGPTPPAPEFPPVEWIIGEPDLIVELPEDEPIPAEGVVDYRYVVVDPGLTEDRWVQASEIRPTNTEATHHVLVLTIPPGKSAREIFSQSDDDFVDQGYFSVQVPGCRPNVYPEGMAKRLVAGTRFLFQLHYTPNGVAGSDRSRMALKWAKGPIHHEVLTRGLYNGRLAIRPGDPDASYNARHTFGQPVRLLSMFPHMHTRGKSFRYELLGEDVDQILLDVPRYDFNWQNFYRLNEPVRIEAGEMIYVTAVYDNSKDNPFNPDPSQYVYWGDQTFQEMMIGYIDYYVEEGERPASAE